MNSQLNEFHKLDEGVEKMEINFFKTNRVKKNLLIIIPSIAS